MSDINLWAAWAGILAGVVTGMGLGLFFHQEQWLGGYGSWRRRMLRLGHISFFGIAFLNLAFAVTVNGSAQWPSLAVPSAAMAAAIVLMPAVCWLSAWRKALRHLFMLPVGCVLVGVIGLMLGRIWP